MLSPGYGSQRGFCSKSGDSHFISFFRVIEGFRHNTRQQCETFDRQARSYTKEFFLFSLQHLDLTLIAITDDEDEYSIACLFFLLFPVLHAFSR